MFAFIKKAIANWYHWRYIQPFTVACDLSMFAYPGNTQERLFHVNGIAAARRFARQWVREHVCGQARVLKGHLTWENSSAD